MNQFKPAGVTLSSDSSRHDLFTIPEDMKQWSKAASLATYVYFRDEGVPVFVKVVLTGRKLTRAPDGELGIRSKVYKIVNDRDGDRLGQKEIAWIV